MIQNCQNCSGKNIKTIEEAPNAGLCKSCTVKTMAYNRYYESGIPIEYWTLSVENIITNANKSQAFESLSKVYNKLTDNLNQSYMDGVAYCLAGSHGVGKTTVSTNILKKACQKNFTALYTNLGDIVNALTIAPGEDKYFARKELTEVDFLVCDEFDSRHMGNTENATDLFGRTLEYVIRTRLQNKLPNIIISNSPNPVESFTGSIKESLNSLLQKFTIVPILGEDIRKVQGTKQ